MTDLVTEFDQPTLVAVEPTINILALDLGTHCGWALARGETLTYGTKNLSARSGDGAGQRWLKFRAMLANHYNAAGELHAVYYEDVKAHGPKDKPNTIAAHVYGGFLAHLEAWCDVQRVRLVPVGVGQVKKSWTGAGNASKDKMIAEARGRGFKVGADEDDTADAPGDSASRDFSGDAMMAMQKTWVAWTTLEEKLLREIHASDRPIKEVMHLFPGRTLKSVTERIRFLDLGPRQHIYRSHVNPSIKWQEITLLMQGGARLTTREIAEKVACSQSWTLALIKRARKLAEERPIHIARWRRARVGDSECCWVEVWAWGDGPDAPKPRVPTHAEHVRIQRLRKRIRAGEQVAVPFGMTALASKAA